MTRSGPGFKTGIKTIRQKKKRKVFPKRIPVTDAENNQITVLETPIKSESDKKSYKVICLENGLRALLISDPSSFIKKEPKESAGSEESSEDGDEEEDDYSESEEGSESDGNDSETDHTKPFSQFEDKVAACALCVNVGSFSDPPDIQGMAHFVEHMVFMGSRKYPVENDFDAFIRKKGGSDNAQTDCEYTTFHFEVQENDLDEAMDRFAQFFVSPLMKQDAMQRERESIESEFALAMPSDSNRREQILCSTLIPGHPAKKFMWGNYKSLTPPYGPTDPQLHLKAHEFRERYYSAHNMTVALQARLPLETLEKYVINTFGQIRNNDEPLDDISGFKFSTNLITSAFNSMYYIKPVMQTTNLTLTWCMKSFYEDYKTKPHQYVAWIIGHEGTGGLLLYLQRKVWALGIYSGISDGGIEHTSVMSMFGLQIILTEEGLRNVDKVIDAVFSYINMLKKECPNERIFNELRQIEEINFRFKDEPQPSDNVEQLAENMQYLPPKYYMTGQDLFFEYDPDGIKYVIDHMSPEYVNIMLQSQSYPEPIEYDQTEEWFGTKYKRVSIKPNVIERWKNIAPEPEFHLPEPNPFIPDNFDLITPPPHIIAHKKAIMDKCNFEFSDIKLELIYPSLIKKTDEMEVWFKPDYRFDLPYTYVLFYFITPLSIQSPKFACLLDLWCTAMNQLLTEKLYAAEVTGLSKTLMVENIGLTLKLHGFSQKLPVVVDEVTQMFLKYSDKLTEELYTALKEVQIKSYSNIVLKPNKMVKEVRLSILMKSYWTVLDKLKAIQQISYSDLKEFGEIFTEKLYVKMLIQGNLVKEDALQISDTLKDNLNWNPLTEEERPKSIVHQLPIGEKHCRISSFNILDENSIITNYYQFGITDIKSYCILEMIMLMMEEPLFDTLRTKEQLGYNVFNMLRYTDGILGFLITVNVQAKKYSTQYVDKRIEEFLKEFLKDVKKMSPKSFEQFKISLIKMKNSVDVELNDEVRRHWGEIITSEYQFNKLVMEIECVKAMDIDEVKMWLENQIKCGMGCNFRKLSVQVVGHEQVEPLEHIDKKTKLSDGLITMLNETNYSLQYLDDFETKVELIKDAKTFKKDLKRYPEIKGTLPPQSDS